MKKFLIAFLLTALIIVPSFCLGSYEETQERFCFGTLCKITIYEKNNQAFEKVWASMYALENQISAKLETSEIGRVNQNAGSGEWIEISENSFSLIEQSLAFSDKCKNAFTPAIGSLTNLWAIGTDEARVPSQEEITQMKKLIANDAILLKKENQKFWCRLEEEGMALDLGAAGKGFATDLACQILEELGVKRALLNFGGDVAVFDFKNGKAFTIGLQDPKAQRGYWFEKIVLKQGSVVTSGSYERNYSDFEGNVWSHVINPETGMPVDGELLSVSIAGLSGLMCDMLSTACFVLGPTEGVKLLEQYPTYYGVFVTDAGVEYVGNTSSLM